MDPTAAIIFGVVVIAIIVIVLVSLSISDKHTNSGYVSTRETPVQTRYQELIQAEARARALELQRANNSQRVDAREVARRKKEFQSRFPCKHKDGCGFVTKGPIVVNRWHGLVDDDNGWWGDVVYDAPYDMYECITCNGWFCRKHIAKIEFEQGQNITGRSAAGYCYSCEVKRMERRT